MIRTAARWGIPFKSANRKRKVAKSSQIRFLSDLMMSTLKAYQHLTPRVSDMTRQNYAHRAKHGFFIRGASLGCNQHVSFTRRVGLVTGVLMNRGTHCTTNIPVTAEGTPPFALPGVGDLLERLGIPPSRGGIN